MSRTFCGAAILRILAAAALAWHPSTRAAEATVELTVVRADTLIGLSHRVLVSPVAWREVARLNHLPDPDLILPGQRLRVPVRLLRSEALSATLISVTGPHVTVRAGAAAVGTPVVEGDFLQTGPDSSAVLALPDGSRVQIAPSSLAEVAMSRHYGSRLPANAAARPTVPADADAPGAWFAGTLRMLHGSIEVFATKVLRAKPLEVVTPTAVVGVRGTRYRVSIDGVDDLRTHAEVLEGMVRFEPASRADRRSTTSSDAADLRSGFGASLSRAGAPDARPPRGSE
ncbi:MAG: FecR domain-containing protein, partial [Pseudomonadota bacterium]|nr:FecR domain-containing protein [Pseudomonadota bacterium]